MTNILIVAGGTGGHIIPAIVFGQWALSSGRARSVRYVCGERPLEKDIYSHFGLSPSILPVQGSPLGIRKIGPVIRRSKDLIRAWTRSRRDLARERPSCVFLFGGYVSLPFLFSLKMGDIPMVLHEQNARAGKVTRLASRLGVPIAAGWSECDPLPADAYISTGIPTRTFQHLQPEDAWNKLNVGRDFPSGPTVLVLGGSLGSSRLMGSIRTIANEAMLKSWTFLIVGASEQPHWASPNVCLLPRTWDLAPHFSVADLAISRGGGSTLSELETQQIPTLVVPWRQAAGDHQKSNALRFMEKGLGAVCDEEDPSPVLTDKLCALYNRRVNFMRSCESHHTIRGNSTNEKLWHSVFESK